MSLGGSRAAREARPSLGTVASERRCGGHPRSSVGLVAKVNLNQGPKMTDEMMALRGLMEKSADADIRPAVRLLAIPVGYQPPKG